MRDGDPIAEGPPHALSVDAALTRLAVGLDGLSHAEAARRRARFGPNEMPEPPPRSLIAILLHQFQSPFVYLLLAAAGLSLALGEWADALFIFIVLAVNAAIGGAQEWRAERDAQGLKKLVVSLVPVRREGRLVVRDGRELVPGDIVELERGMRVPADIRLIRETALKLDESLLTGESLPVAKDAEARLEANAPLGDRATMLFAGTALAAGRAAGVVVATGAETEIGHIAGALATGQDAAPPLIARMEAFTRTMGLGVLGVIAFIALIELTRGAPAGDVILIAIALAVAAIPEGLPVAMTIVLAISVNRMATRRVLVRNLAAVEGLGSCTVIASDKTGTLTKNELTVRELWLPEAGRIAAEDPRAARAAAIVAPAIEAELGPEGTRDGAAGDTLDIALRAWTASIASLPAGALVRTRLPYEPENRFGGVFCDVSGACEAVVKGAPETILEMCGGDRAAVRAAAEAMARDALRVIALAAGPVAGDHPGALKGLRLIALIGLIDPPRDDAAEAVARALGAGIDVRMVTGDHPETGLAIARAIGLAETLDEVVTGAALAAMEPAALREAVARAKVFARIEPLQKRAIVDALMANGAFVAVTGDGVNDAAALQAAHIGVAMGQSGTDVAREASDLILLDDRFSSIVAAVEEGRVAYDNLRKVIWLLLSTGAAEILLFLLSTLTGLPPPLSAVQLLWLNLVTNGIQDVALAFEGPEPGRLKQRPRPPGQPIIDRVMLSESVLSGLAMGAIAFGFYAYALAQGWDHAATTSALIWLLLCLENGQVLNCRSETRSVFAVPLAANPFVIAAVMGTQILQVVASVTPGLSDVLGLAPLPLEVWAAMAALALPLIALVEAQKLWRRLTPRR